MHSTGGGIRVPTVTLSLIVVAALVVVLMTGTAAGQQIINECQELDTQGETYELNTDIQNQTTSTCLEITANDIVLDGKGFRVDGVNETGASVGIEVDANDVTVKNFGNVTRWDDGIGLAEVERTTLLDNTANNNGDNGIIGLTAGSTMTDNAANNNGDNGIHLITSSQNDLTDNTANENGLYGIWVEDGSNFNNLTDNVARDNSGAGGPTAGIYLGSAPPASASNNTLVNNTATGDQTYGIYLMQADENELRENTANENNQTGIYLTGDSTDNNLTDNTANRNGKGFGGGLGIYGIWLSGNSNNNTLTGNEAFDNGVYDDGGIGPIEEGTGVPSAGIYLGGAFVGNSISNNKLVDNEVGDTDDALSSVGGDQLYGIWLSQANESELIDNTASRNFQYGIWLTQASNNNELIDNVAEDNSPIGDLSISEEKDTAGIYLGGIVGPRPSVGNTLVNNTAIGSEYGIWIRNSFDNDVSESLALENEEGITVEESISDGGDGIYGGDGITVESIESTGNTFTDDVSRNNNWDFVVETEEFSRVLSADSASDLPVTNLSIGASTAPETTLSFAADDVRLSSADNPEPDPDDGENIGRYFEAEQTSLDAFLNVSLSYEDSDVSGVNESTLELQRFDDGPNEWLPTGSSVDTTNDLVSVNITTFSDFGAFGESDGDGGANGNPFFDASDNPLSRQEVISRVVQWNLNGNIDGTQYTRQEIIGFIVEWNLSQ